MRKQVKCTFGIMKQRFSILRHGIRLSSIKYCNEIWITCRAMHNILFFHYGYNTNWNSTEFEAYTNSETHVNPCHDTSFAMERLNRQITGNIGRSESCVDEDSFSKYVVKYI